METALWLYAFENGIVSPVDVVCGCIAASVAMAIICLIVCLFKR